MKIIDYIFYRAYIAYEKADEGGYFSGIIYLSCCLLGFMFPLLAAFWSLMKCDREHTNSIMTKTTGGLFLLFIIICVSIRYLKYRKYERLRDDFYDSKLNSIIPTWTLWFLVLPICFIGGVACSLKIQQLMESYNLAGIGYRWLCEVLPGVF